MKIISLKLKISTILVFFVICQGIIAQNNSKNQSQKFENTFRANKESKSNNPNSNRLLLPVITGNFSICLPGSPTTQLTATLPPAAGNPWVSSNPAVATIDATGLVTQVSFGATTITYTDNLGNTYSENVYVATFPTISTPNGTSTCAGGTLQIDGSLFPNALTPWTSLTPAIASVDNAGLITGNSGGIATIQYMNLGGCTTTTTITINPLLIPNVTCGATTTSQITFNWSAVAGATTYVRSYQIGAGPFQSAGSSNALFYTLTGLLPSTTVTFYVAPSGSVGSCFQVGQVTCSTLPCNAATTPVTPTIGLITPPSCILTTGSVAISGLPAGNWTINQTGTAANSIVGNTASTTISGLATGNYTFTVTNDLGCTSVATANVNIPAQPPTPAAAISTGDITQCQQLPIQTLDANNAITPIVGQTVSWYTLPVGGVLVPSPTLNAVGTVTYYAQVFDGTCNSLTRTSVKLTITGTPTAPISTGDITQCEQLPIQTLDANNAITVIPGQTISWYTLAVGGVLVPAPTLNTVGTITYYAQANDGSCNSLTRTSVKLTITGAPAAPISTGDITQCEQLPIQTLDANNAITVIPGQTISWYTLAVGGALVATPTLNTVGTITYYAQANDGTCNSTTRTSVKLTITGAPATPISTGDITQCEQLPIQTLDANNAITVIPGQTITWYTLAVGGVLVPSPTLNAVGTATYYAQAFDGTCNSLTRTSVKLTITGTPAAPISTGDITQCEQIILQTLDANNAITVLSGQTISWYDQLTGGTLVTTPTLNATGSITYYAETKVGNCLSLTRTRVILTINAAPAPPVSGGDIFQCEQNPLQTITATATVPAGQNVIWYDTPTAGTVVPNPSINTAISIVYFAEAFNGTCPSLTRTPVILTINELPADPAIGLLTQPDCFTATGSITIFPVPAGITYSFDNGPFTTTTFYGLLPGGTTHTLVAKNTGGCSSSTITVTILPQPTTPAAPILVVTQPTCTLPTGEITITPISGETYSFDGGPFTNQLVYTGLIAASTHTVKAKNSDGCFSATSSATLNIQPLTPAPPTLTPIQPTCTEPTGTVQISNVLGQTYSFDGSPYTATLNYPGLAGGSTHTVTAKNGSGCFSAPSTITLNIQPPTPSTPAFFVAQPNCTDALGEITILNVGLETYSFDGGPYTSNLIYPNLQPGTYTITAANSFPCFSAVASVTVNPQPITLTPAIIDGVICTDEATGIPFRTHILDTGLNPATHSFVWTLDGIVIAPTSSSINVSVPGVYTVVATNISTGCDSPVATATVTTSFPGLGIATQVINQFSNEAAIIVNVASGTGPFTYQLDNGPVQESNVFSPAVPGSHVVYVKDVNGCTDLTTEVTVLGYMTFFTPNNDAYNDTWNVIGLENQPGTLIHIYDRYGKYIKQVSANGKGWDGTLNGQPLPSTDYWFTVEYTENGQSKEFKSHFSLVR